MVTDSPQIRRIAIAYLYQNAVSLNRADNLQFYDALQKQEIDVPELQQQPRELVLLRREPGPTVYEIRVGAVDVAAGVGAQPSPGTFRLLVAELAPRRAFKIFEESADTVYAEFQTVWGGRTGRVQLVEVNCQVAFEVRDTGGATAFIHKRMLGSAADAITNHLGRAYGVFGVRLGSGVALAGPEQVGALAGSQLDLVIDADMQNPAVLLVNSTVKWPALQVRTADLQMPAAARAALGGKEIFEANREPAEPTKYLGPVYKYVTENIARFLKGLEA